MFLKISLVALTVTLIGISTAKPSFGPNKGLEEALESIADFDEDNDEKSSMDESTKAIVLKLLMQQAKLQLDEGVMTTQRVIMMMRIMKTIWKQKVNSGEHLLRMLGKKSAIILDPVPKKNWSRQ